MPLPLACYALRSERQRASTYIEAPGPLRIWHLASLDAPTVAVVWSLSFAQAAGVHLPLWVPALIALGTWFVYVGDRILDAWRALGTGKIETLRERHFFQWRHRRVLIPLAVGAALASAAIIFGVMPPTLRQRDSVLAVAAVAYFSGIHVPGARPQWFGRLRSKEFLVGVLFTAGCALPTLTRLHGLARNGVPFALALLVMSGFAALAWLNCAAIDRWEAGGESAVESPAKQLAAGAVVLALASVPILPRLSMLSAACAGSALLLALLDRRRDRLTPLALRCAADLVLLVPVFCLVG